MFRRKGRKRLKSHSSAQYHTFADLVKDEVWAVISRRYLKKSSTECRVEPYRYHLEGMVYAFSLMKRSKPSLIDDTNDVVHIPIDGVLDLHTFDPKEVASLVNEYLDACLEEEIYDIRIIHGKGKGVLRRTVHAVLEKHPAVVDYKLDTGSSSWGATIVRITPS